MTTNPTDPQPPADPPADDPQPQPQPETEGDRHAVYDKTLLRYVGSVGTKAEATKQMRELTKAGKGAKVESDYEVRKV